MLEANQNEDLEKIVVETLNAIQNKELYKKWEVIHVPSGGM